MGYPDAFIAITTAILAILLMIIAAGEVRQQAYKEGHRDGTAEATMDASMREMRKRMQAGGKIAVEHLSTKEILDGIRHYIYICGDEIKGRELHKRFWMKEVENLDVERKEEFKGDWIKMLKEFDIE